MRNFFHANTSGLRKASVIMSAVPGAVLLLPALLCFMSLYFDRSATVSVQAVLMRAGLAAACVAVWLVISFSVYVLCRRRMNGISRHTYFEIQQNAFILSRYAGRVLGGGGGPVRRLYVISVQDLKLSMKNGRLIFEGDIRQYEGGSETLGYHIKRGKPEFDEWWLNVNGYKRINRIELPACFEKQSFIFRCCKIALARSQRAAQIRKAPPGVRRPALKRRSSRGRMYTELPTFDRNW